MRPFSPQPKPEKQPKKKAKYIKPRSAKRAKQEREYAKLRLEFLSANPCCFACGAKATQIQHSKGRIGDLLTDVRHFKASCHECNLRAERDPKWAQRIGFSISRLNTEQ